MYTIIGGDGKEYGPVTADQVRSWIAGGRANMETKARAAGTDEWRRIGDFGELSGSVAAGAGAPATPGVPAAPALDIIRCYERSWALLKANFWSLVGVSFLMAAIFSCLGYTYFLGVFFVTPLFGGVLSGGWCYYFLLKIRGQPASIGDAFAGFTRAFITLVATAFLISIFLAVGFVCLFLPMVYLFVAYQFTYMLATDKRLGIWESMETSRRVITRNWWQMLGLILLGIPFFILGIAAFGVGIFVAVPFIVGALAYAYEDLCGARP
jgi:GYF domain 2